MILLSYRYQEITPLRRQIVLKPISALYIELLEMYIDEVHIDYAISDLYWLL